MAATSVALLFTGRGGKDTRDNHRTYTRVYEVITDDPADDEQIVSNASAGGTTVPLPGDPLDTDPGAVVVSIDFQQSDDDPQIWYATCEYDTDPPTNDRDKPDERVDLDGNVIDKNQRAENPLDEPAQWALTFEDSTEPAIEGIEVDEAGNLVIVNPPAWAAGITYKRGAYVKNGGNVYLCVSSTGDQESAAAGPGPAGQGANIADNDLEWNFYATFAQTQNDPNYAIRVAILSSAALPYDPPPTVEVSRPVLSVTKNTAMGGPDYVLALKNAVNLYPWRGLPPRCARVKNVTHEGGRQQGGIFYVVTKWEIVIDADTHDLRVLDSGLYEKVTYEDQVTLQQVTDYQRIKDSSDEPITEPVPLDGNGHRLKPDDPPVFRRYVPRQMRLVDFNTLLPF